MEPENDGLEDDFPFQTGDFFRLQPFVSRACIRLKAIIVSFLREPWG